VPEDCHDSERDGCGWTLIVGKKEGEQTRGNRPFCEVGQQSDGTPFGPENPSDIRGADVSAAVLANINPPHHPANEQTERNRPDEIAGEYERGGQKHEKTLRKTAGTGDNPAGKVFNGAGSPNSIATDSLRHELR
jgi:hypothetical protein